MNAAAALTTSPLRLLADMIDLLMPASDGRPSRESAHMPLYPNSSVGALLERECPWGAVCCAVDDAAYEETEAEAEVTDAVGAVAGPATASASSAAVHSFSIAFYHISMYR